MAPIIVPSASKLPRPILQTGAIGMVLLWIALAFWGVLFIAKGMVDFVSFFPADRLYGIVYTVIGVSILLQIRTRVLLMKKRGLMTMMRNFLEHRFLEVVATSIFMLMIALLVTMSIEFIASWILVLPLILGTSFGFGFGQFMEQVLHVPYAPVLVLASAWLLELFWIYLFSWFVVRILFRFQLVSAID